MADEKPLYNELTSLLEALPPAHLIEIARQAALGGFKGICQKLLGDQTLESALASVFPDFSEARIAGVAREMALCAVRNRCWSQMLSLPDEFRVQIRSANPKRAEALRQRTGPAILTFWHLGASFMMGIGLQRIRVPGLIIARNPPPAWFRRAVSPVEKIPFSENVRKLPGCAGLPQMKSARQTFRRDWADKSFGIGLTDFARLCDAGVFGKVRRLPVFQRRLFSRGLQPHKFSFRQSACHSIA